MGTTFQRRLSKERPLFIPFITAGDPKPDTTIELALTLQDAGAHILELGVPYSDPLADGPTIQKASQRALKNGMTLKKAMELVPRMREKGLKIPVIMFTYYNPVLQLGEDTFFALAQKNDIDGLLIPDIPHEESESLRNRCKAEGLEFISLVAPTSSGRIEMIAKEASGFVYCVSSLGVTGVRKSISDSIFPFLKEVKEHSSVPVAVGFGISSHEQVEILKDHCDGIVVGSAIVKKVEELEEKLMNDDPDAIQSIKEFVKSIIEPKQTSEVQS